MHPLRFPPRYRKNLRDATGRHLKILTDTEDAPTGTGPLPERPTHRSECRDGPRPCQFISCSAHLYLDVDPRTGSVILNFPEVPPDELERLPETCCLDVAERGEHTLEQVGEYMNVTRERVRQIEEQAMNKMVETD